MSSSRNVSLHICTIIVILFIAGANFVCTEARQRSALPPERIDPKPQLIDAAAELADPDYFESKIIQGATQYQARIIMQFGGQPMPATLDTGSSAPIVGARGCPNCGCDQPLNCYDPTVSDPPGAIIPCGTPGYCEAKACRDKKQCLFGETFAGDRPVQGTMFRDSTMIGIQLMPDASFGGVLEDPAGVMKNGAILGLEANRSSASWGPTILDQYADRFNLSRKVGFCLWDGQGQIDIGNANDDSYLEMEYFPFQPDDVHNNRVALRGFQLQTPFTEPGQGLQIPIKAPFLTPFLVDSGTSIIQVKTGVWRSIRDFLQSYYTKDGECSVEYICGKRNIFTEGPTKAWSNIQFGQLPKLSVGIEMSDGTLGYVWLFPQQYMVRQMNYPNTYTFGIQEGPDNILGLNFMRQRYTLFDYEKNRLGLGGVNIQKLCTPSSWSEVSQIYAPAARLSVFAHEGRQYLFGGINYRNIDNEWKNSAAPFASRFAGNWRKEPMAPGDNIGRRPCVALDGYAYCAGGIKLKSRKVQTKTYRLKLGANSAQAKWEKLGSLRTGRWGHNAVACNGTIYVLGGYHSKYDESMVRPMNSIERFDPKKKSWHRLSTKIPAKIAERGAACIDDQIYLVGGRWGNNSSEQGASDRIDIYDPRHNVWDTAVLPEVMENPVAFTDDQRLYIQSNRGLWQMKSPKTASGYVRLPYLNDNRDFPGMFYDAKQRALFAFGGRVRGNSARSYERYALPGQQSGSAEAK